MQRTKDSGTRRCETQGAYYQFNDACAVYIYDYTNNFFYQSTTNTQTTYGASPNGIVGPAGFSNVNLNWGSGYIGGGDIANSLNNPSANNQAIAYLSMGDSKGVGSAQLEQCDLLQWHLADGGRPRHPWQPRHHQRLLAHHTRLLSFVGL